MVFYLGTRKVTDIWGQSLGPNHITSFLYVASLYSLTTGKPANKPADGPGPLFKELTT